MTRPDAILQSVLERVAADPSVSTIADMEVRLRVESVCRQPRNRACARLLLACLLAKLDRPEVDPRKPYTEIGGEDSFSGRSYDEKYVTRFIHDARLPLNPTTAFLTPAFRNLDRPLTTDLDLLGRPRQVYRDALQLLDDVHVGRVSPQDLLCEIVRLLIVMREEGRERMNSLLSSLASADEGLPLSSEEIVRLVQRHLQCRNSSRLPVLVVAAAYETIRDRLGERVLPLHTHTAADEQTGSLGDIEICLDNDNHVVTVYEMKMKRITIEDVDRALEKITSAQPRVHNYIFITTETIPEEVRNYAAGCYGRTEGTEITVLECINFLRHFLHLFHRSRTSYLDAYQKLVLQEPDSAVSQPLKEALLALRLAAESDR